MTEQTYIGGRGQVAIYVLQPETAEKPVVVVADVGLKIVAELGSAPYPVVAGRMVHPTLRKVCARAVEQDPSYKHPRARGV